MNQQTSSGSGPTGSPATPPRAQTLAAQGLVNKIVLVLLGTPLLCRLVGSRLVALYVVGRRTGRHYTIPVAYTHHDGRLLVGTPFGWGRNLRTGDTIDIRLKGRRRPADVTVTKDEAGVTELYAVMARGNHQFASLNKIALDADGNPDPGDLHLAWAAGARAIQLDPR